MSSGSRSETGMLRLKELESDYEILEELGRGGTAVVYRARDRELGRKVAIKVIRSTYVEDEEVVARLVREAKTVAQLQHPNIVMLHGTRTLDDGSLALIMQYAPGLPLKDLIRRRGPLPFTRAEKILRDIGEALAYAHRRKIVHRDVKPENIYLDREADHARLSDFGLARPWDTDSGVTVPGMTIGTPAYMSPEQIDGEELDGRSDLYSLGLVGYEMLAGESTWPGENIYDTIFRQKHEQLPPVEDVREGVPESLALAVRGCLAKDREKRWSDVREFLEVLDGRRPVDAPPLKHGGWLESEEHQEPPLLAERPDDRTGVAEDAPTVRFRRDEEGAPELVADRRAPGQPEDTAASQASEGDSRPDRPRAEDGKRTEPSPGAPVAEAPTSEAANAGPDRMWKAALSVAAVVGFVVLTAGAIALGLRPGGVPTPDPGSTGAASESRTGAPGPGNAESGQDAADAGGAGISPVRGVDDAGPETTPSDPRAEAETGPPARLTVLSGGGQVGRTGEMLPVPITVALRDSAGAPVRGAEVGFTVTGGGGEVTPTSVAANEAGIAEALWRLGPQAGEQEVVARVEGRPSLTAAIQATATGRAPSDVAVISGAEQESPPGSRLSGPVRVRVTDETGAAVSGATVTFRSTGADGEVEPSSTTTDEDGIAEASWTVGREIGVDTLMAFLPEQDEPAITVTADVRVPPLSPRSMIAAGGTHTCELRGSGRAACWGANGSGQLGTGRTQRELEAARVITGVRLARLVAGVSFTCGLSPDRRAYCWGANGSGQLGIGPRGSVATPESVETDGRFSELGAGADHACGVALDGRILCWGSNEFGQLGDGTQSDPNVPTEVSGDRRYGELAVGWGHTCALDSEGNALCWGRNSSGELGDGTGMSRSAPSEVIGNRGFVTLAAGSAHTCGLTDDGELLCWGQNSYGQLGVGDTANRLAPTEVSAEVTFTDVVAGGVHTCALADDGQAYCWGRNAYGQLGDGTTSDRSRPTRVAGDQRFTDLSTRGAHTCGTTAEGITYCWGYNSDGQLGDGTRSTSPVPVRAVADPS